MLGTGPLKHGVSISAVDWSDHTTRKATAFRHHLQDRLGSAGLGSLVFQKATDVRKGLRARQHERAVVGTLRIAAL